MMIPSPLKGGKTLFLLPFLIPLLSFLPLADVSGAQGGPLLLQVHFMNPLRGVSIPEAEAILRGDTGPLAKAAGLAGGFTVYADKNIALNLAREYPHLKFTECDSAATPPESNRGALLLSDLRGIAPSMKILPVDRRYPWGAMEDDYGLKKEPYPLLKEWAAPWEPSRHITVVQTGVTAMTRVFTSQVRRHGDILRPVSGMRHITAAADLAVTSNEVSFVEKCPTPLPDRMAFCSPCDFLDILKYAGFDVIELTGNHNNDYGMEAGLIRSTVQKRRDEVFRRRSRHQRSQQRMLCEIGRYYISLPRIQRIRTAGGLGHGKGPWRGQADSAGFPLRHRRGGQKGRRGHSHGTVGKRG